MLEESEFVTIVITVPVTHADLIRDCLGKAGAGEIGCYSHCSFSYKGIGRFKPKEGADPFLGKTGVLETVEEEKIETVCEKKRLKKVIEAVQKAHPYEETVIDIFPVYRLGMKQGRLA